jgi:glycosyltransferase involved in cell wall biosynthesis
VKVLLGHNFYRSTAPSGEDAVYRNERALLERHLEVIPYERFNDEIDESTLGKKIALALDGAWSKSTYQDVSALIKKARPDIAHFHNTFPQISPSAYGACRDNGVPVVQTLHNFRFICPGGLLLRDSRPCEDCVGTTLLPALRHRCYRGSLPATSALVWMLGRNRWRGTYQTMVNRYIALTEFAASRLVAGDLPKHRISIKPNFAPGLSIPGTGDGGYAVYTGRLSVEKGVRTLLSAWKLLPGVPLKILGDGPLRPELEQFTTQEKLPVEFLGFCNRDTVMNVVGRAAAQIVPSECYEGFPLAVVEAYACGTPVIASQIGSLEEIVKDGVTGVKFEPGNSCDLAAKVHALWSNAAQRSALRRSTRDTFEKKYTEERNVKTLMAIYDAVIKGGPPVDCGSLCAAVVTSG